MVKQIIPAISFIVLLSSCSTFKPLQFTSSRQVATIAAPAPQAKFIDDISVTPPATQEVKEVISGPRENFTTGSFNLAGTSVITDEAGRLTGLNKISGSSIENASAVQLKYAILLNTEVESLPNKTLLESVDNWYGVRYRTGGNGKSGIDCSGFTVAVYEAAYGINLPRVSREQYRISRKISTTELQEGDLVFFNTRGSGVSHVGIYLGNNKFIHATVSKGVMVNSLFENYYIKRFIGAGRIDDKQVVAAN